MKIIKNSEVSISCSTDEDKGLNGAMKHIEAAIDCLGAVIESDDKALDAIAGLGVILLDLK